MAISTPPEGPESTPDTRLLDRQISKELDKRGLVAKGGGGHMGGMTADDQRLTKLENDVSAIKGSLDWAKIAFTMLLAVALAGFGILITVSFNLSSKIDSISTTISEEFRSQRLEQSAQISAVANAMAAAKQQTPQVLLLPTPTSSSAPPPQPK